MAEAPQQDRQLVTVVLRAVAPSRAKASVHPDNETIQHIRGLWAEEFGVPADSFVIVQHDVVLSDEMTLGTLDEAEPALIHLTVENKTRLLVCNPAEPDQQELTVALSQKPEDLHADVRQLFGMDAQRLFRLRTATRVLFYNLSLHANGVEEGALLLIDFQFQIEVEDQWTERSRPLDVFGSDPAADIMADAPVAEQRLVTRSEIRGAPPIILNAEGDVAEALAPIGGSIIGSFRLFLEVMRQISLIANHLLGTRRVWPTDTVGRALRNSARDDHRHRQEAVLDGDLVARGARFQDLRLPEDAMLHLGPLRLTVWPSQSGPRLVRLPRDATVRDLRDAAISTGAPSDFRLRCRGRFMDNDNESLVSAGLQDGDAVAVVKNGLAIKVSMAGNSYDLQFARRRVRYTDIIIQISAILKKTVYEVMGIELQCKGCGLKITAAKRQLQSIPLSCCEVRSLVLEHRTRGCSSVQAGVARRHRASNQTEDTAESIAIMEAEFGRLKENLTAAECRIEAQDKSHMSIIYENKQHMKEMAAYISMLEATAEEMSSTMKNNENASLAAAAGAIAAVQVAVSRPTENTVAEWTDVELGGAAATWRSVLPAVQRRLSSRIDGPAAVVLQFGVLYRRGGAVRRAVDSTDASGRQRAYRDEGDGAEVAWSDRTHQVLRVLLPDAAVRPCPGHLPLLEVRAPARVLEAAGDEPRLEETGPPALLDPRAAALLLGVEERRSGATFILTTDGVLCDVSTGRHFPDREAAARAQSGASGEQRWGHVLLLLPAGGRLPRWRIPRDRTLLVYTRLGVQAAVDGRRLRRAGGRAELPTCDWLTPKFAGEFGKALTAAVRDDST